MRRVSSSSKWSAAQPVGQRRSLHELQDERVDAVRFVQSVDDGDVRVIERPEHARFALAAGQGARRRLPALREAP